MQRHSSLPPPVPRKTRFLPADSHTGCEGVGNELFSIRLQGVNPITTSASAQKSSSEAEVLELRAVSPGPWLSCRATATGPQ